MEKYNTPIKELKDTCGVIPPYIYACSQCGAECGGYWHKRVYGEILCFDCKRKKRKLNNMVEKVYVLKGADAFEIGMELNKMALVLSEAELAKIKSSIDRIAEIIASKEV